MPLGCIAQVPPVLCAASRLEVLDLSGLPGLEVALRDVRCTLARMPRLSLLLLGKQAACPGAAPGGPLGLEWRTPSVAALVALGQALPHLQVRRCTACKHALCWHRRGLARCPQLTGNAAGVAAPDRRAGGRQPSGRPAVGWRAGPAQLDVLSRTNLPCVHPPPPIRRSTLSTRRPSSRASERAQRLPRTASCPEQRHPCTTNQPVQPVCSPLMSVAAT